MAISATAASSHSIVILLHWKWRRLTESFTAHCASLGLIFVRDTIIRSVLEDWITHRCTGNAYLISGRARPHRVFILPQARGMFFLSLFGLPLAIRIAFPFFFVISFFLSMYLGSWCEYLVPVVPSTMTSCHGIALRCLLPLQHYDVVPVPVS